VFTVSSWAIFLAIPSVFGLLRCANLPKLLRFDVLLRRSEWRTTWDPWVNLSNYMDPGRYWRLPSTATSALQSARLEVAAGISEVIDGTALGMLFGDANRPDVLTVEWNGARVFDGVHFRG
jgi:hypothetical protein